MIHQTTYQSRQYDDATSTLPAKENGYSFEGNACLDAIIGYIASVSDSADNGKSGDKGVGQAGKGYASEGQQDVVSRPDIAHSAANANPKTDASSKRKRYAASVGMI